MEIKTITVHFQNRERMAAESETRAVSMADDNAGLASLPDLIF